MATPIVTNNYLKERAGVLKIALALNSYGYVFRETSNGDVGIDGQIEHVNENRETTGKIIAAQIKSGNSYLVDKGDHFVFYPDEKHRNYWSIFPLPVILFVYYPQDDRIYFTDVRLQLNTPNKSNSYITLKKSTYLNDTTASEIFKTTGIFDIPYYPIEKVFDIMLNTVCPNPTFSMSFLDLFTQGLTDLCRHVYFSMDLAVGIAKLNNETEYGLGIGSYEYEFLHDYVKFIMSQNLVNVDYTDYLIDWDSRGIVPTFLAPVVKSRGNEFFDYINSIEEIYKTELYTTSLVSDIFLDVKLDNIKLSNVKKLKALLPKRSD